jgi:hypothetical protein
MSRGGASVVAAMDATQIEEEIPMVETAPFK